MDMIIEEIRNIKLDPMIKDELLELYVEYKRLRESNIALRQKADRILESIFKTDFNYTIPMSFINTELGKMLLRIKLDMKPTDFYGALECAIISGKTRTLMVKDLTQGKLGGRKIGGHYFVSADSLINYITTSGWHPFSYDEALNRIRSFDELRDQLEDMSEVERVFEKRFPRRYKQDRKE